MKMFSGLAIYNQAIIFSLLCYLDDYLDHHFPEQIFFFSVKLQNTKLLLENNMKDFN